MTESQTWIVLLRGINVGGTNILRKADFLACLAQAGGLRGETYLQSGNALCEAPGSAAALARRLADTLAQRQGLSLPVMVLSPGELATALAGNPFRQGEGPYAGLHLGILAEAPVAPNRERLEALAQGEEAFALNGRFFYLHAPAGVGRSRLFAGAEAALGRPVTFRNGNTLYRLLELARARNADS